MSANNFVASNFLERKVELARRAWRRRQNAPRRGRDPRAAVARGIALQVVRWADVRAKLRNGSSRLFYFSSRLISRLHR